MAAGASCAALGQAQVVVTEESTNWGLAVGVGVGVAVVGLLVGVFAGWGVARVRTRRRHASMVLKSSGLEEGHVLARTGVKGDGGSGGGAGVGKAASSKGGHAHGMLVGGSGVLVCGCMWACVIACGHV